MEQLLHYVTCPHCWVETWNFVMMLRYSRIATWVSMTIARFS